MCFDIVNRLDVDHDCDGRTDRQTEPLLAIARLTTRAKTSRLGRRTADRYASVGKVIFKHLIFDHICSRRDLNL